MYFQDNDLSVMFVYNMLKTTNRKCRHELPRISIGNGINVGILLHNNNHLWS